MQRTCGIITLLSLLSALALADKIPPTSGGAYYCGTQKVGYTVYFQGLGYDNDSQNGGQTPYYRWDFDSDYEFSPDLTTTSWLVSHTYTEAGKHIVGVQYVDDDGQEGGVYVFEITIESDSLRRYYYLKDHLGSIRVTVDAQGVVKGYDDYDPWGMVLEGRSSNTANVNDKYKFTGKERDVETGYDYFGARYYDSRIGRWLSVDPMAEKYPGWTPYNYVMDGPLNNVDPDGMDWYNLGGEKNPDIQWRDGSEDQLKPGVANWVADLFGFGEYAKSLGANVLVGYGAAPSEDCSISEDVNGATFELYTESFKLGATATISGNTISADPDQYATIAGGVYSANLVQYKGRPALKLNGGGRVPTVGDNPNPESNYYQRNGADKIYFHMGCTGHEDLWSHEGEPISTGCQTGSNGHPKDYLEFMKNFPPAWKGNYYLIRH